MNFKPLIVKDRSILETYDFTDEENTGRPLFWSLDNHIVAIEQMIAADEIQIALKMCDEIPGWYRDHYPKELHEIKERLYQQCYDQFDYSSDFDEANWRLDDIESQCFSPYTWPRADILAAHISELNQANETPWIFEISPSHGWLPLGFKKNGLKFHFFGKNMNQAALKKIIDNMDGYWREKPEENQKKILVCYEALEHMWNAHDLKQAAYKTGIVYDSIYLSTPKYTLGGGLSDWKTRRLGHVRTWTPKEFTQFASEAFPGYSWEIWPRHSMVLRGTRVEKKEQVQGKENG